MQKVYLLLRDNKQSGPHSLEELLDLNLKPFDLIWIEGRSCGWSYPSEIEALRLFVPGAATEPSAPVQELTPDHLPASHRAYVPATRQATTGQATSSHVFVSMPYKAAQQPQPVAGPGSEDSLEKKAGELRQRAEAYTAQRSSEPVEEGLTTRFSRPLDDVEEQYTNWVIEHKIKKKSRKSGKSVAALVVGIIVLAGGFYAGQGLWSKRNQEPITQSGGAPRQAQPVLPIPEEEEPQSNRVPLAGTDDQPVAPEVPPAKGKITAAKKLPASRKELVPQSRVSDSTPYWQDETPLQEKAVTSRPTVGEEDRVGAAAPAEKEKKKSLGQKIDGFFDKLASRKKDEVQEEEGQVQHSTRPGDSGRQSVRRGEEGHSTVDPTMLARQVEVVGSNPESWMMGVHNLKLTVRNRSSETLKNAAVEVSYYTEENSLLEKKVVYVTDIPPGKAKTIKAPDQRLADHADYRLLSVTPAEGY